MSGWNIDPNAEGRLEKNPYQPTAPYPDGRPQSPAAGYYTSAADGTAYETATLASPLQRFLGMLLDSLVMFLAVIPGVILLIIALVMGIDAQQRKEDPPEEFALTLVFGIGLSLLGIVAYFALQIFLLATRSQTVGKYLMKCQVVDFETGKPADFLQVAILRILVNGIICNLPLIGFFYFIVDSCFIFREDRRCIHDLLASTTVIDISHR